MMLRRSGSKMAGESIRVLVPHLGVETAAIEAGAVPSPVKTVQGAAIAKPRKFMRFQHDPGDRRIAHVLR